MLALAQILEGSEIDGAASLEHVADR